MVTAMILFEIDRKNLNAIASSISEIGGVAEVYSVSGRYDLVAVLRVASNEELADIVTKKLLVIDGILKSETMLAFRCFSKYDLERMFTIGD
jgi:DNA-binding Lrp family transcriptional regulator